jgi:hypothetical protein
MESSPSTECPSPGGRGWHDPAGWIAAERGSGRALAKSAAAAARLDERLRRLPAEDRALFRERIALTEASDLLWAEGVRLRPERLALAERGRIGRVWDGEQAVARAAWAVRRMTARPEVPETLSSIRSFLGLHAVPTERAGGGIDRDALWLDGLDDGAVADWCAALAALAEVHPLTRAAAGFHLWRGFALSSPERVLEPAVMAARIGAAMAQDGLAAIPLAFGNPRAVPAPGGDAAARLGGWLGAIAGATLRVQAVLDRLDAWQARAERATADMQGKGAPGLIRLMVARPMLSAADVAEALQVSAAQARLLLNRLAGKALIREVTGQERFRIWTIPL